MSAPTKLLIVEDNQDTAQVLESKSRENGIEAVVANSGENALSRLTETGAKVVLLDILLPDMDGLELLKKIRDTDELSGTVVIAITASNDPGLEDRAMELGASEFFFKPETNIHDLFRSVQKYLEK